MRLDNEEIFISTSWAHYDLTGFSHPSARGKRTWIYSRPHLKIIISLFKETLQVINHQLPLYHRSRFCIRLEHIHINGQSWQNSNNYMYLPYLHRKLLIYLLAKLIIVCNFYIHAFDILDMAIIFCITLNWCSGLQQKNILACAKHQNELLPIDTPLTKFKAQTNYT